eukprot:TRINITY_DN5266_c0_g1_i2.p1 TRINITY_DN5266_c0_g1~~TRINITY_DN5266_c0_g1_i2.p1  ORF type:complete len:156 (+),score=26.63 TRINITY_DN5266_c0_g1_i2:48-515(+)
MASGTIAECLFFPEETKSERDPGPNFIKFQNYIKNAKSSLDICVYTITDNRISKVLIDLHKKGVKVRVITDDEKADDLGSDVQEFIKAGIPVKVDRSPFFMHHKFVVIDNSILLNGSFNWTKGACFNNRENIMVTNDPAFVKPFDKEFEKLWVMF